MGNKFKNKILTKFLKCIKQLQQKMSLYVE
jgi:hypothetical protein